MWASFEFLMSGLLLVGEGGEIKKAGTRVVGWSPPRFFFLEMGSRHPSIPAPSPRRGRLGRPHPPTPHAKHPISPHIDEDALEGVYFAFSLILRCLPYFCQKTRPRASCDLLRAHSRVLVAVGLQGAGVHRRAPSGIVQACR